MNKELMDMINEALEKLAKKGDKSAKIMLLDSEFRDIMHNLIEKYCIEIEKNNKPKDYVINFYEQIIHSAKELSEKIEAELL